ncbi:MULTISPECIES: PaaI family thioesterase [unclassified Brevundimonas]|uniref:PaaI family thioesterase n=1 Tax=unclassified Brevundimonas TaxID=2622653 RepID=UPI003F91E497
MIAPLLDSLPYARFLDLRTQVNGNELTVVMPFQDKLIGNPMLPALHGGSTAALLEMTAVAQVSLTYPRLRLPRPINVTVAYLRSGKPSDVYARARINKAGRRVAHVVAEAWQESRDHPIAALTAHFLLDEGDDAT